MCVAPRLTVPRALTTAPLCTIALVLFLTTPTSTPPTTPTNPPATPPANDRVLRALPERTVTPCAEEAPELLLRWLICAPESICAEVAELISETATPPAMPTRTPPSAAATCVTFSVDSACTITPCAEPVFKELVPVAPQVRMPLIANPVVASASTCALALIPASVSLVRLSTPTENPMPASPKPPAPEIEIMSVSSSASTATLPPANTVAPDPMLAVVVVVTTGTVTAPPTPTMPPPMPTPNKNMFSAVCASTTTSARAFTVAPALIAAVVLSVSTVPP